MYFDSHAHYDDERFDDDRNELLASFHDEGIENVVNSSSDIASSKASVALTEKYPFFYASVGVHPHEVEKMTCLLYTSTSANDLPVSSKGHSPFIVSVVPVISLYSS